MTWQDAAFWEIVLDLIALGLCATAVITMVRQRKKRQLSPGTGGRQSFEDVLEVISHEERAVPEKANPPFHFGAARNIRCDDPREDRYHEVDHLADAGLAVEEITRMTDIPKGEVELVMKLRKQACERFVESRLKSAAG